MLLTKRYHIAGWVAIMNAALTVPILVFFIFLSQKIGLNWSTFTRFKYEKELGIIQIAVILLNTGLFVFAFSSLQKLLNAFFNFERVNKHIQALVCLYIIHQFLFLASIFSNLSYAFLYQFLTDVAFGIVFIVFGIKLLSLSANLFGFLKPFCYISIATGISFSSSIFMMLGGHPLLTLLWNLAGIAEMIVLGIIFFKATEQLFTS